jgi:hypothetical protein
MKLNKTQTQMLRRTQKELKESVKNTALRLRSWQKMPLDDRNTWVVLTSLAQNLLLGAAAGAHTRKLLAGEDQSAKRPRSRRAA